MTDFGEYVPSEMKQSKYNSALAQLYRLDNLWQDSHRHARNINYALWNEDLDRVWLELSSDCDDKGREKMAKINEKISMLNVYANLSKVKEIKPLLLAKIINLQKKALMEKEEFLRLLLNKQGKGSAYEDAIEDYMDG